MQMIWQAIRNHKLWLIGLLIAVAAGAGGTVYYKNSRQPVTSVNTEMVGRGDITATVSSTGTISAVNSVDISSRVTGLITQLNVKENDIVKAGAVLVVLDDSSLRAQLAQYKAQLTNYAAIYERSQKLAAIGAESDQQLDADRTNYEVAQANYDNYASQLTYYVIKSPIDGMVVGKPTPAGQTVAQGISTPQVIMTIADMSQMQIKVMVDETDIGKVKEGQTVTFTVDAYTDQTFTGRVTGISRSATTTSNVVYYPVYVDVDSSQGLLYPTMTARVIFKVGESKNVLIVPLAVIKEQNGQKYVQVMIDGQPQNEAVEVGLTDDENAEILSGLNEGELIVIPATKARTTTTNKDAGGPPPRI